MAASYKGHETIVRLPVDRGAGINVQDNHYCIALQAALSEGHEAVVRLLVDHWSG
jgi:ankyrin repeat protein